MGSSSYGPYVGISGGSQPYAEIYSVIPRVLSVDKENTTVYTKKNGYFHNPTSVHIEKSIKNGRIYLNNNKANGPKMYVLDKNGNMLIGLRINPNDGSNKAPHPTLIGGKNPKVKCAGMITFNKGKIVSINNESGHFRPNIKSMNKVYKYLKDLYKTNPEVFSKDFKWRK